MLLLRHAALALAAALLASCTPTETKQGPAHPLLDGIWQSRIATEKCDQEHVRFDKTRIVLRHQRQDVMMFEIVNIEARGSTLDLELAFAKFTLHAIRESNDDFSTLSKRKLFVSLNVTGDSISMQDLQFADPDRGRYSPSRNDREKISEVFTFRKCAPLSN